jgi:NAD(P)-dependent dehydrogenase (short-subunit alcohol dehydrogenase family)
MVRVPNMQRPTAKTCVVTGAATAAEIGARFIRLDVGREEDWLRLAEAVPVADVVVNKAGITGFEGGPVSHDPEHASLEDCGRSIGSTSTA